MGVEIERKFLVANDGWRPASSGGVRFCQGYLAEDEAKVRIRRAGHRACVTIKGPRRGISRPEYEYVIPVDDAEELFKLCRRPLIEKTRHTVRDRGHFWSVDTYGGSNSGLTIAEIELESPDEKFERPHWLGREITGDRRYSNVTLRILPINAANGRSAA